MVKVVPNYKTLTVQQKYLLERLPLKWDMNGLHIEEPPKVRAARKLIEQWDKRQGLARCRQDKRNDALLRKAKEAIYFESPQKALAIVRQCEKMLKGCEVV